MKNILTLIAAIAICIPFMAPRAEAQFVFMPYVGYDFDVEDIFIGAAAEFGLMPANGLPFALNFRPGAEVYLIGDGASLFQLNGEAIARLAAPGSPLGFFAGAGLGVAFWSVDAGPGGNVSSTDIGLNLLGGADFGSGFIVPFAQARLTTATSTRLQLMGGIKLNL